jgi:hypothetical protein
MSDALPSNQKTLHQRAMSFLSELQNTRNWDQVVLYDLIREMLDANWQRPVTTTKDSARVQGFWSPDRKYITTVIVTDDSINVIDDNGRTWRTTSVERLCGDPSPVETTDDSAAFAEFANYIAREMPEGTVIGDPAWWAPRLWRFARYAKSLRTPTGESSPSETTRELVAESPQGCASESPSPLKAAAEHQGMTFECATCRATVTLSFTDQSKRSLDIRNLAGWNAAPNGVWCPQCSKTKGYVLGYLNSGPLPSPSTPSTRPDPLADVRWICEHCTTVNGIDDEKCLGCRKPRSQVKTSREPGYMGDINGPGCDPDVP